MASDWENLPANKRNEAGTGRAPARERCYVAGAPPLSFQRMTGAPHPGFPVTCGGVDALHAAFLNESRTPGSHLRPGTGNPGISLVLREMWDSTALSL